MVRGVEEVWKEASPGFRESEGFGKGGQWHLEKAEQVFEHNVTSVDRHGQDLGSVDDLFWYDILFVKFIQDQIRIEAL